MFTRNVLISLGLFLLASSAFATPANPFELHARQTSIDEQASTSKLLFISPRDFSTNLLIQYSYISS